MNHKIRPINFFLAVFALLFIYSCNSNIVYSKYKSFDENEWLIKDKAIFDIEIKDTFSLNNISLMVRHADSYEYKNLFLFVTSKYPDGRILIDTMEIILANKKGEWLGSGLGDIYDFKVPIKKNIRFAKSGKYQFIFEQGMRVNPLPLIMDFGFEIEKSN